MTYCVGVLVNDGVIFASDSRTNAGVDNFSQFETKYGKPILDRLITASTTLEDAAKCVLVSFDSTMRSNLSVAMPIDLLCYEKESFNAQQRRRLEPGDEYFSRLSGAWSEGVRRVFTELPEPNW